jgi:hypothetical protein
MLKSIQSSGATPQWIQRQDKAKIKKQIEKTFELIDAQINSKSGSYTHWVHLQRQDKAKLKK